MSTLVMKSWELTKVAAYKVAFFFALTTLVVIGPIMIWNDPWVASPDWGLTLRIADQTIRLFTLSFWVTGWIGLTALFIWAATQLWSLGRTKLDQ